MVGGNDTKQTNKHKLKDWWKVVPGKHQESRLDWSVQWRSRHWIQTAYWSKNETVWEEECGIGVSVIHRDLSRFSGTILSNGRKPEIQPRRSHLQDASTDYYILIFRYYSRKHTPHRLRTPSFRGSSWSHWLLSSSCKKKGVFSLGCQESQSPFQRGTGSRTQTSCQTLFCKDRRLEFCLVCNWLRLNTKTRLDLKG